MTLIQEAVLADDIGVALTKYRDPNPDYVQNINAAIAELANLSWALREIDKLLEDHGEYLHLIEEDLKLVHESVSFMLADIWYIIGTLGERSDGRSDSPLFPEDYRRNWRKIIKYNRGRGRQDFSTRLDKHKRLLHALCKTLESQASTGDSSGPPYRDGRDDLDVLRRDIQDFAHPAARRLAEDERQAPQVVFTTLQTPVTSTLINKRSYERNRDLAPMSPSESGSSTSPFTAPPYAVPSPPLSPSGTFSTVSQVSSTDRNVEHWALRVFRDVPSWTPLPTSSDRSEYHDMPGQPRYDHPSENYDEVVALSFPPDPPGLRVSLYSRRKDWRAKIVAQWRDRRGKRCMACIPLNILRVYRIGPMLHFCRRLNDGKTNLAWLSMKFTTVERLVLFASTFLSMRAHDGKKPERPIDDWELEGEECEYAGKIRDSGFSHALRIYRDTTSKAVRLQASAYGGQLENTPVWTAFITHYVASKTWCQKLERNAVCLRELRPHNFFNDYEFQRLPNGAFVLNFETRRDADDFFKTIELVGRSHRRAQT